MPLTSGIIKRLIRFIRNKYKNGVDVVESGRRLTVSRSADLPQNRTYRSVYGSSLVYAATDL